ncbi:Ger(x)C family spore germination protein [Paenibacillus mesophilus]|uniref:Ger(x)C family spore germination protein n=1 Tax=Paenibacillus mesophilus TaxID=2582849 RepID=UPI00110DF452|nr:Ger(x)C family spore germination protein [Paenibacillus mesophilus]TMV47419.1 Ger(x)C family spore germination protein [Paenibacillus mesophilus]
MNRKSRLVLLVLLALSLSGCGGGDRKDLEDLTIVLIVGIDLDENNNVIFYESSPVFSKEAKDKEEQYGVKAMTFREAREKFDTKVTALTVGGEIELVLLGKKLLASDDWFRLLDIFYREEKSTVSARVVAVDGPVKDIIYEKAENKPRLPLHLTKLIDTSYRRNLTVKTTLQELRRQVTDKGLTPSISEIKKGKGLELKGTALLDERGKYALPLGIEENALFHILMGRRVGEMTITISIPDAERSTGKIETNKLSFMAERISTNTRSSYEKGRFHFDLNASLGVNMVERLFADDPSIDLERIIAEQLRMKLKALIAKFQAHRIDPLGLGMYARAFHYKEWKQVQEHWGEELAKSDINVSVKVEIKKKGAVK